MIIKVTDNRIDDKHELFKEAEMVAKLSKQMINNADVVLRTQKLVSECGLERSVIQSFVA